MRRIIKDDEECQVQLDEGMEYNYRKDFIAKGDGVKEYSLALIYSRKSNIVPPIGNEGVFDGDAPAAVREGAQPAL